MPRPTVKSLQVTVAEQEATILRLRSENSQLLARLASHAQDLAAAGEGDATGNKFFPAPRLSRMILGESV